MLDDNMERVLKIVQQIEHNAFVHSKGIHYRSQLDIKDEPDAFIIAAVDWYVQNEIPKGSNVLFLTLDGTSLADRPEVQELMKERKVKLFNDFKSCIAYLKNLQRVN